MRTTTKPRRRIGFRYQRKRRRFTRLCKKLFRQIAREESVLRVDYQPDEVYVLVEVETQG